MLRRDLGWWQIDKKRHGARIHLSVQHNVTVKHKQPFRAVPTFRRGVGVGSGGFEGQAVVAFADVDVEVEQICVFRYHLVLEIRMTVVELLDRLTR